MSLKVIAATFGNDDPSLFDILSSHNVLTPQFLSMTRNGQLAIFVLGWINAIVFSYFRSIFYKYIFKQHRSKTITEVNILTTIVCVVQHLEIIGGLIHDTLLVTIGDDWPDVIPPLFCILNFKMKRFVWSYSVIGSLGIAIYRIMLIKCDLLVRDKIGTKRLMWIILVSEVVLVTLLIGVIPVYNPFLNPLKPACMYAFGQSSMKILDDYRQSLGHPALLDNDILIQLANGIIVLVLEAAEIVIYVTFFHHMYKHDNKEGLKKLLEVDEIKRRNKANAMSFFSLFCSFLVETVFCILMIMCIKFLTSDNGLLQASLQLRKYSLSVMAIVEVLTSSKLRSMII